MLIQLFDQLRIIVDFGLFILIWLVQTIIYPSFQYCEEQHRRTWHNTYTGLITVFVVPLMFGQVGIVGWQILFDPSAAHVIAGLLVFACWVVTFAWSVPQHSKIAAATSLDSSNRAVRRLIISNWPRTLLWTAVLVLGIADNNFRQFFQ